MWRRSTALATLVMVAVMGIAAPQTVSAAAEANLQINRPITGNAGTRHKVAETRLDNGRYEVIVTAKTQDSKHPQTSIIVHSGDKEVRVEDVERNGFGQQTAKTRLEVTGPVTVYVQLGPDKVYSSTHDVRLRKTAAAVQPSAAAPPVMATRPTELPQTGATPYLLIAAAVSLAAYLLHVRTLRSRRG